MVLNGRIQGFGRAKPSQAKESQLAARVRKVWLHFKGRTNPSELDIVNSSWYPILNNSRNDTVIFKIHSKKYDEKKMQDVKKKKGTAAPSPPPFRTNQAVFMLLGIIHHFDFKLNTLCKM